jgi:hypothetical protein
VGGLPRLWNEDHLCDFPLSRKASMEQYSIEDLGEELKANGRWIQLHKGAANCIQKLVS